MTVMLHLLQEKNKRKCAALGKVTAIELFSVLMERHSVPGRREAQERPPVIRTSFEALPDRIEAPAQVSSPTTVFLTFFQNDT